MCATSRLAVEQQVCCIEDIQVRDRCAVNGGRTPAGRAGGIASRRCLGVANAITDLHLSALQVDSLGLSARVGTRRVWHRNPGLTFGWLHER